MQRRFFADQPINNEFTVLRGPDAHHISNVMRLKTSDTILLFDGSGKEFTGEIQEIKKKEVIIRIVDSLAVSRELSVDLTMCVALPKGDRQKILVEKLVEIGVTRLIPIRCARSVVVPNTKSIEKMERWGTEACKQCGRNRLMEIAEPIDFLPLLAMQNHRQKRLLVHPYAAPIKASDRLAESAKFDSYVIGVGPEGGFNDEEILMAKNADWQILKLGVAILRIETAAVVAATLFGIGLD